MAKREMKNLIGEDVVLDITDGETLEEIKEEEEIVNKVNNKKPGKFINGRVINCSKLRVRKSPNIKAAVIQELPRNSVVKIDLEGSTDNFYRVFIESKEGFCMKEYIEV